MDANRRLTRCLTTMLLGIAVLLPLTAWITRGSDACCKAPLILPMTPGRQLHIVIWTVEQEQPWLGVARAPHARKHAADGVTLGIWYQTWGAAAVRLRRLVLVRVPIWPLILLSMGAVLTAARLWLSREITRDAVEPTSGQGMCPRGQSTP